jgi:ribose transport system permease protein
MMSEITYQRKRFIRIINDQRALILLVIVFFVGALFAPRFFNRYNISSILQGASLASVVAIGFTIVFIIGHIDLSVGAVVMLSGMLVLGLRSNSGWSWIMSVVAAVLTGTCIGMLNGLLVAKAKIHSFIVTLGMMKVVIGLMYMYNKGSTIALTDFTLADFLYLEAIPFFPVRVLITIALILIFSIFLNKTRFGKNLFIVGGNPETAMAAGISLGRYTILGFMISGTLAAVGGVIFALGLGTMSSKEVLANTTLMTVLSGTIIGGTLMSGGSGSVIKSFFAIVMLTALLNIIGCFGMSFEIQLFVNGLIFALVVIYEAFATYHQNLLKGQRPRLMKEVSKLRSRG